MTIVICKPVPKRKPAPKPEPVLKTRIVVARDPARTPRGPRVKVKD